MATTKPLLPLLQQRIWNARLPLEIRISRDESRQYASTPPYLTLVPRLSYLPFLLERLHRYFSPMLIADPATISPEEGYFTFDGIPLKWHYPIGLLYDMYVLSVQDPAGPASGGGEHTNTSNSSSSSSSNNNNNSNLPLVLTLHFNRPSSSSSSPPPPSAAATAAEAAMMAIIGIIPSPVVLHDAFINSLKEADFVRSGTAKPIMSLPTSESKSLWTSTQANDLPAWAKVHGSLLPKPGQWRGIPLRIFLPVLLDGDGDGDGDNNNSGGNSNTKNNNDDENNKDDDDGNDDDDDDDDDDNDEEDRDNYTNKSAKKQQHHHHHYHYPSKPRAQIRVVQAHIPPVITTTTTAATTGGAAAAARIPAGAQHHQQQTLGSALNSLFPSLFPSRRTAVLARPILHGAPVPMSANLEELARWCCYADGWVGVVVGVNG